jgi:hypothetical protein
VYLWKRGHSKIDAVPIVMYCVFVYQLYIWYRLFSVVMSSRRPAFKPRRSHVEFVVDEVALGHFSLERFASPLSLPLHQVSTLIHLSPTLFNVSRWHVFKWHITECNSQVRRRSPEVHLELTNFIIINVNFVSKGFVCLFVLWRDSPQWARDSSFTRLLGHTQRRTAVGRTPLDE